MIHPRIHKGYNRHLDDLTDTYINFLSYGTRFMRIKLETVDFFFFVLIEIWDSLLII
jgi:hypothetical protein